MRGLELLSWTVRPGHWRRGLAYLKLHDTDRAILHFDRAVKLEPRNAAALKHRAEAYRAAGDRKRAAADYDAAIRLDPKDVLPVMQRGFLHRELQDYDRALDDFGCAIGETKRAIQDFDQASHLDDHFAEAFLNRGIILQGANQVDLGRHQRACPPQAEGRLFALQSLMMRALGHDAEAEIDIAKAKEFKPGIGP